VSTLLKLYHRLPIPLRSVAATARGFYLRYWRYGRRTARLVEEALERDTWSRARWQQWQEGRLAEMLHRAATQVPYYREQWSKRRRSGDRASWEVLANWPILEKDEVQKYGPAFVADDCARWRMMCERTSGTTGTPLAIWKTRPMLQELYALSVARTRRWNGVTDHHRWAVLAGQLVVPVAQRKPPFWVWNAALHQLYMSTYHLAADLVPHYHDALARYRIDYIAGYASSLYAVALEALHLGRDDLRMAVALSRAEPLLDHQRAVISAAFHCPVRQTYGMDENVAAASECTADGLHTWPEAGWIEVFAGGRPVPPGTPGEFLCTSLLNRGMPLVRYRVGDHGQLADPAEACRCGRELPVIKSIDGRTNDLLLTADGRPVFWLNPIFYEIPVRQAQIIQEGLERVRVRYVPGPRFTGQSADTITQRLRSRLGEVAVELEAVAELPRLQNGKMRAVICLIPRKEREAILRRVAVTDAPDARRPD
jgi:phenylacetate-CoA ligase